MSKRRNGSYLEIYIIALSLILIVFLFAGCSSSAKPEVTQTSTETHVSPKLSTPSSSTQKEDAQSFVGVWSAPWGTEGLTLVATIDDTGIVINWVDSVDNSAALYWKGTFPVAGPDGVYISKGDLAAMAESPLAETVEKEKKFTATKDTLEFHVPIMGVFKNITMERK